MKHASRQFPTRQQEVQNMALIRYNPTAKVTPRFHFDRFFADFDRPLGTPARRSSSEWSPAVDIY